MGCAPDLPLQRLQAVLGALQMCRADLEIDVRHVVTGEQLADLRRACLDLGLIHATAAPGFVVERVYRGEAFAAVVGLAHRVALRESTTLADLAGDVLLVVPRRAEPGIHDRIVALAASDGGRFREVREAPGADLRDLLFAVASGRGVTLAPRSTLRAVGELGTAVAACSLAAPAAMPDTCLAWPADARDELVRVYDAAREVARELRRP
jgi:hypothetical protein